MAKTNRELHQQLDQIADGLINSGHLVPVDVTGGRKFRGKGYLIEIEELEDSYSPVWRVNGHVHMSQDGWAYSRAKIWNPANGKIEYANYKFCELDPTVSREEMDQVELNVKTAIVNETLAYCRSRLGESATLADVQMFAQNCLAKRYAKAFIDPKKMIQVDPEAIAAKEFEYVSNTIDWAMRLGYKQIKTENTIMQALWRKRIDYRKHEDVLSLKFTLNGWTKFKRMNFTISEDNVAEKSGM